MAYATDIRDSLMSIWESWPNREAVVFRLYSTPTTYEDYEIGTDDVPEAKRRVLSTKELAASNGRYTGSDIVFHIPYESMPDYVTPRVGDQIIDHAQPSQDGGLQNEERTWTVLELNQQVLGTRWKCVCRDMVIANGLTDTITIYTPTVSLDATGAQTRSWTAVHSNLAARVQPENTDQFDSRGIRASKVNYSVFVPQDVTVRNSNGDWGKIVWGSVTLDITGYQQAERIDVLPVIQATDDP